MTDTVTIELQDAALLRAIGNTLALLENPRALMTEIGATLERNANERFNAKVDPSGVPWPPLARNTVDYWYAKKYPDGIPGSLLERSGQLRASLTYNAGDSWVDIGTSRVVPGKSRPEWQVGFLHEFGTRIMPRRGILTADPNTGTLGAGDQEDVLRVLSRFLDQAMG